MTGGGDGGVDGRVAGLRIAIVNWRDEWHPAAGGAEVYAGEMARALAARGATVTFFTARGEAQARTDRRDGVTYLRRGGRWSVYPHTLLRLLVRRRRIDVVLDCQNGVPFFSPLVVRRRTAVICVIHHVHQEQFGLHFPGPLAAVGRLLEGPVAARVYGRRPAVAVSPSTRTAVRRRLHWRGSIFVIPNGTPRPATTQQHRRSPRPTIVTVSRLVPHKRIELLVRATADLVRTGRPDLSVHIVGTGPDESGLRALVRDLGLSGNVHVHGYLDEATKDVLLGTAWLTVNPTAGEGWGLGVIEAAAMGVPAVAFDVDGMRDSICEGATGWLLPEGADLAAGIDSALDRLDRGQATVAEACRQWARSFSWAESAARMSGLISVEHETRRKRPLARRRSDLVTFSEFNVSDPAAFLSAAHRRLRGTDRFGVAGNRGWLLTYGSDDHDLWQVVDELGGVDAVYRVAVATDLLRGVPELAAADLDAPGRQSQVA